MFPDRLRELLSLSGLGKQEFAKRRCGVSYPMFNRYLNGFADPSIETLARIARTCGVSQEWLRGNSDDREADL